MTHNETRLTEAYRPPPSQPPGTGRQGTGRIALAAPEDMAPMVVFLASDEAKHVTGASSESTG
ncbi:hypothetical protein DEIPH_ctg046orf0044 [Deinococcus phoenicis]|uniref:Short-chain dehydrogenase/reductase SDR n=1 Tax=Deinococcus phoenicis TaxID=1476583 RepID=A0A016QMX8_9DEIO|nr:hypothetical protein [Deinococcus phoenicis]EYB67242.1 hypothetical protein DEIPH_ctg046orf0044 [Deinococcus phoenicis]